MRGLGRMCAFRVNAQLPRRQVRRQAEIAVDTAEDCRLVKQAARNCSGRLQRGKKNGIPSGNNSDNGRGEQCCGRTCARAVRAVPARLVARCVLRCAVAHARRKAQLRRPCTIAGNKFPKM
eukprot:5849936-Pleurochrysis_carterae.AAC.1